MTPVCELTQQQPLYVTLQGNVDPRLTVEILQKSEPNSSQSGLRHTQILKRKKLRVHFFAFPFYNVGTRQLTNGLWTKANELANFTHKHSDVSTH